MPHLNTVFAELLKHLPGHQFEKAVSARNGDRYVKRFTAWNHAYHASLCPDKPQGEPAED